MADLGQLIGYWGYPAIFVIVILGNLGLPVPEETVLTVAGYLAWKGQVRFSIVVAVGILSAVMADNIAYWMGRRYGRHLFTRWVAVTPRRLEWMQRFVRRYGMLAVFVSRFVAGLRFMAGPLAGSAGMAPGRFFVANLLGAALYVPVTVSVGYAVGYGFGEQVERFRRLAGDVVLIAVVAAAVALWAALTLRARNRKAAGSQTR